MISNAEVILRSKGLALRKQWTKLLRIYDHGLEPGTTLLGQMLDFWNFVTVTMISKEVDRGRSVFYSQWGDRAIL